MTMDDLLNTRIALRMQEVAGEVWEELALLLPYGSYTANQVYEFFTKEGGKEKKFSDIMYGLPKVCYEEVSIKVESFKCCVPKYMLYKILHQFEKLASIGTKNRKKFIRQSNAGKDTDVSFIVEITKPMMSLTKSTDDKKGLRPTLKRVALDYATGYVVATNSKLMSVQKAGYRDVSAKEGASVMPVLMTPEIFKKCMGSTMVSSTEKNGMPEKYCYLAEDGGYYEEEAVGRYVNWQSVVPRELFRSGRVTLSKDGLKQFQKFAKTAEKNADVDDEGQCLIMQTEGDDLVLFYLKDGKMQTQNIPLDEEPAPFTICIDPIWVKLLDGWNGTMWISKCDRPIIFDMKGTSDFHLLMPKLRPDGIDVQDGINGTKVSFDERHAEYKNQQTDGKQNRKQTSKQKQEVKPIKYLFMAAERYEGTQPFYTLEEIERGEFKIKGSHDSELVLFLRTAAHYIRQSQEMQAEFCGYCREQMTGKDWRNLVPLEEMALAEMFEGFLTSKGINDIPDVEFEDAIEEVTEEVENQFVDNLEMVEVPAVVEEVEAEEIEAEEVIEEAVEVIEEATIKPMAIEREIVPTLELETSEGTLIVAGESYFHKLYDEDEGCFRSEAAEAKFNEIDAFIADELITADELDYAAIAQAVGEFMEEVEQAS